MLTRVSATRDAAAVGCISPANQSAQMEDWEADWRASGSVKEEPIGRVAEDGGGFLFARQRNGAPLRLVIALAF